MTRLLEIADRLNDELADLTFDDPVSHVYRPLEYARPVHRDYLASFGTNSPREVLLVGMNPGPWGMAQTGVPFGDVDFVNDWMGLNGDVGTPDDPHPDRPVEGLACDRNEVSGSRLWGWAEERFGPPEAFFDRFFVYNYCPLLFLEESARNRAPSRLRVAECDKFIPACDRALLGVVDALDPRFIVGVGNWARDRIRDAFEQSSLEPDATLGGILHPSPASPKANQGWVEQAEAELEEIGIEL